jgi:hypothetical protein
MPRHVDLFQCGDRLGISRFLRLIQRDLVILPEPVDCVKT